VEEAAALVLAIGPTWVYLILGVVFLTVLGGGVYMAYRIETGRQSKPAEAAGTPGHVGAEGDEP
jgi:hypothetical protein